MMNIFAPQKNRVESEERSYSYSLEQSVSSVSSFDDITYSASLISSFIVRGVGKINTNKF